MLDQKRLNWLCRDVGESRTREMFSQNEVFGTDLIFKEYCNLDPDYQMRAILPSGPVLYDHKPWSGFAQYPINVVMDCDPSKARDWATIGKTHFVPTACAFAYLVEMMITADMPNRNIKFEGERKGSIFFLPHSDRWLSSETNYDELKSRLEALPDKYKPITISLFWRDYNEGKHKHFPGYNIVSTGHRFDPVHFYRLYHLINMHKYVIVNGWTMPPVHALLMNKPVRLITGLEPKLELREQSLKHPPKVQDMMLENKPLLEGKAAFNHSWIVQQFEDFDGDEPTVEQVTYANQVSGVPYIKHPQELLLDFMMAERMMRYEIK